MRGHTPGNWEADGMAVFVGKKCIAVTDTDNASVPRMEANAKLMAAAPELLANLKFLLGVVNDSRGVEGFHLNGDIAEWSEFEDEITAAQMAVIKAEGAS